MKEKSVKRSLPFVVDRNRNLPLIAQIADGIRQAVQVGFFKPGDKLPGFREIAEELGTSMIVVRAAFARLADEGIVCRRRHAGTIIMPSVKQGWRGHVVIASVEVRENHLLSAMTGSLRQDLMKAGYQVSFVPFGSGFGHYDFTHLESVLRNSVTLVVATSCSPEIDRFLSRTDVPYIVFGSSSKSSGSINLDCSGAVADFVKYAQANEIKRVIEVTVGSDMATSANALRQAGIACRTWPIVRRGGIEEISRATLKAFYGEMERYGHSWLPDAFYFNDNFAAQAALTVLLESGVDIPGEVRFVTWSNAGEGPFWRKELTRIEIDPLDSGRIFARQVLKFLAGGRIGADASISPHFVPGET